MYHIATYNDIACMHLPRTLTKVLGSTSNMLSIDILLASDVFTRGKSAPPDLYQNQTILVDHLCDTVFTPDRLIAGSATCILNMRAGMGKTHTAAGVIARLGFRTLYIVPKLPLALQAVNDLRACLDSLNIGMYSADVINQDITVIVINSALMRDAAFFAGYSCTVLDEVHAYCSGQRRRIFRMATSRAVLGMSATTDDRNDKADIIAHKELAFDGIIHAESVPGFTYEDVNFDCTVRIVDYVGPAEHTQNLTHEATGLIFTHYMHNQYIDDPFRIQIAVAELIRLYDWRGQHDQRHHIYVFAEEIEILKKARIAFAAALQSRRDVDREIVLPEAGLEMFTGGLKDIEIDNIQKHGRILFSTYGYAGTGISIQKMSAVLLLTPRKANMKQIIARILRRGSDPTIPRVIVDLVDKRTALKHQLGARLLAYDFYGFKREVIKISYTDVTVNNVP